MSHGLCTAIVAAAVSAHFAFLGYLVAGGFLAWRHPRTLALHVVAAAWAVCITMAGALECPLTIVERWARARGGMAPLPEDGFIAHYVTGVFYPASAETAVRWAVIALVAASWAGAAMLQHRRRARSVDHGLAASPQPPGRGAGV